MDRLVQIPRHWNVVLLKHLCVRSALYGANVPETSYRTSGLRFVRTMDITETGDLTPRGVCTSAEEVAEYRLGHGDLLISRSGTVGRSFLYDAEVHPPAAYAGYLVRFVLGSDLDPRFAFFYTKSRSFLSFVQVNTIQSTISNVNGQKYARCPFPVPPIAEQRRIAQVLDGRTQDIDTLIVDRTKLLDLLAEHRRSLVNRVVTRGLKPSVGFRPSGVAWLGNVPAHWEVVRLRACADVRASNVDKHSRVGEKPVRLCNYLDVYHHESITGRMPFMSATASVEEIDRFHLAAGDVLITKDSEASDDIGVPAFVSNTAPDLICGYHVYILRPKERRVIGKYLCRLLQCVAIAYQIRVSAKGVTRYGLSLGDIKSVRIPLPPLAEQEAIVQHTDRLTREVEAAISAGQREIALLKEYRDGLISDMVTGRLSVREAAERLPEPGREDS